MIIEDKATKGKPATSRKFTDDTGHTIRVTVHGETQPPWPDRPAPNITVEDPGCVDTPAPQPTDCQQHDCSYYSHYLRHGPPQLSHADFHKAESECLKLQAKTETMPLPTMLERRLDRLEGLVRA